MAPKVCKNDVTIKHLAATLEKQYGSAPSAFDQGYPIYSSDSIEKMNERIDGAGDGCLSYREVMNEAISMATMESLFTCGSDNALVRTLATEHDIKLPWIFYDEANGTSFDDARWGHAIDYAQDVRDDVVADGFKPKSYDFNMELGRRIFEEIVPSEAVKKGSFDPQTAVWRLYSAMLAAGLDAEFVALPMDSTGNTTPYHVALSIRVDENCDIIADPAYGIYDLDMMPAVPITFTQSLAMYHGHMAMKTQDSIEHLERSLKLDPTNLQTWFYWAHAKADGPNPLKPFKNMYRKRFEEAKIAVQISPLAEMPVPDKAR